MNKLLAIWYSVCIIFLYYVVRPVDCTLMAAIDSGLLNKGHFVNYFKYHWEKEYGHPECLWGMVKSLWRGDE